MLKLIKFEIDKKVYLCRYCKWHGLEPNKYNIGGMFLQVKCPKCTNLIRQYSLIG